MDEAVPPSTKRVFTLTNATRGFPEFGARSQDSNDNPKPSKKQKKSEPEPPPPSFSFPPPQEDKEPAPLSDEEKEQKRSLCLLIRTYKQKFATKFADIVTTDLDTKSIDDLTDIVANMRYILSAGASTGYVSIGIGLGLSVYEGVAVSQGLKVQNLSLTLQSDQEWQELVAEAELEYGSIGSMPVEYRIAAKVAKTSFIIHKLNTMRETRDVPKDSSFVPEAIVNKYKDL